MNVPPKLPPDGDDDPEVVPMQSAIRWIAHGSWHDLATGPRRLSVITQGDEDLTFDYRFTGGREALALELLLQRIWRGEVRMYVPRPISEDLSGQSATYAGGGTSFVAIGLQDLLQWFPERSAEDQNRAVTFIRWWASASDGEAGEAPPLPTDRLPRKSLVSDRTKCQKWFREQVAQNGTAKSKDELYAEALEFLPGLSRRAFNSCWDAEAPQSWKQSGRKPRHE